MKTPNSLKNDRRASKPLMEKRRRERINKSLNELKTILLAAMRKDVSFLIFFFKYHLNDSLYLSLIFYSLNFKLVNIIKDTAKFKLLFFF